MYVTEHIPQVSIYMSMYNASKYLRECIDSVLTQTFKDFEFLIVDDGSNDDSMEIVKSYHDNRIRLIQNTHDYIGSLNMLLDEARGNILLAWMLTILCCQNGYKFSLTIWNIIRLLILSLQECTI